MTQTDAFIGLGSNVGEPVAQVRAALGALDRLPDSRLQVASPLYQSQPMGPQDQPDFINAVAWLTTALAPHALLDELQQIETAAGRQRNGQRWGPRPLDLDLLLYGDARIANERLTVPHPGVAERPFVLRPLADIAGDRAIPGDERCVMDICAALADDSLRRLADGE